VQQPMSTPTPSNKVCVSIPTDDETEVKLGHFGDAKVYLHYIYDNGWRLVRRVYNPYSGIHEHDETEPGKRRKILELNSGCNIIVAVAFGKGGREFMERNGIRVIIVKPRTTINDALVLVEKQFGVGVQG